MMGCSLQVVNQDGAANADFVAQEASVGELGIKAVVSPDYLAGVGFPRVKEDPRSVGMPFGGRAKQRTLCRAIRSGKGAELDDQVAVGPEIGQPHLRAVVQRRQGGVGSGVAGMEVTRESGEFRHLGSGFHVAVESLVVVSGR